MTTIHMYDFDDYLKSQGYKLLKTMNYSRIVNIAENSQGAKTIIKRDKGHPTDDQTLVENGVLTRLNGLERLPKKILFRRNLEKQITPTFRKELTPGLKDYFLEEQFIDGNVWNFEQLSTSEEQKLINLVKTFHKEGYSRMDLRRINFILNPNQELYYVDSGNCVRKDDKNFKYHLADDLRTLDKLLEMSQGVF